MTPSKSPTSLKLSALVVGGGMITEEVVLPTLFQQQRQGVIGEITLVSRRAATIRHLREVFPNQRFNGVPDPATTNLEASHPDAFREAIQALPKPGLAGFCSLSYLQ